MKKILIGFISLVLHSGLLMAQHDILEDSVPLMSKYALRTRQFVQECDSNSRVTNMSMSMDVSEKKLPKPSSNKGVKRYKLYSKSRNIVLSFKYEADNRIIFWLDRNEKHCFILDTLYKFSFTTYDLKKDVLEVYGKVKWDKFYQNFCIFFFAKSGKVYFDFDDDGHRVSEGQR